VTRASVIVNALKMPEEPTQARRFGKARVARSTTLLEDYIELIGDLLAVYGEARAADVAKRLGVTHSTALKCLGRLKREGLITARPYRGIFLTAAGRELAERVSMRHRLMVELLLAVGVPTEAAEADAEGMEHHASATTLEAFARFLEQRSETARPRDATTGIVQRNPTAPAGNISPEAMSRPIEGSSSTKPARRIAKTKSRS
jgi:DtxR family manganese transport transcriptional regulator